MSSEESVEIWVVMDRHGTGMAWEQEGVAMFHAREQGHRFPEQGPWRVVRYVEGGVVEDLEDLEHLEHLVRFLARAWMDAEALIYEHAPGDALAKYPVIQGTRNQFNLMKVGRQPYDTGRLHAAVRRMLGDEDDRG